MNEVATVRKESKIKTVYAAFHNFLVWLYNALYGFVFHSFKSMNRKVMIKLPVWRMKEETLEHVHSTVKVFKWLILPSILIYVCANLCFFGENALDSALWGILIFFYSSFLPDLPSIYRRKKKREESEDLPWYKKYALLLFAPLLIWILYSGFQLGWRTTATFHDLRSLTIYGAFLFLLSLLFFGRFPISVENIIRIVCVPLYGAIGYLTHLKVDKLL